MSESFGSRSEAWMREALGLARRGLYTARPNPRVGCVLVRDGAIVGRGYHARAGEAHAEINALRDAGELARGATAYVTLEPCAHHGRTGPCAQALIDAGVAEVICAHRDPDPRVNGGGFARLGEAGVRVREGLLAAEARALNAGFLRRISGGRPWVWLKSAASLDGRTALADGESRWITGTAAREDVHRLRAQTGCVVTGIGTVLADDPQLTVRLDGVDAPQPGCVLVDRELACPPAARVLAHPGGCLIATAPSQLDTPAADALRRAGAGLLAIPESQGRLDLAVLLDELAAREHNEVMVEAGAGLAGSFLAARLVDVWRIYLAPHLLGPQARPLAALAPLPSMDDRPAFAWQDVRRVGDDLRLELVPRHSD